MAARHQRQQSLKKIGFGAHLRVPRSLIGSHRAHALPSYILCACSFHFPFHFERFYFTVFIFFSPQNGKCASCNALCFLTTYNTKAPHTQCLAPASSRLHLTAQPRTFIHITLARCRNRIHFSSCFRRRRRHRHRRRRRRHRHSPNTVIIDTVAAFLATCWRLIFPKPSCPPFRFICSPS